MILPIPELGDKPLVCGDIAEVMGLILLTIYHRLLTSLTLGRLIDR